MAEFNQKETALFMQLVMTFQAAAWQQMGKIKNPLTDKIERDLDQARYSIDMLEMIRSKSRGNLNEDEQRFLNHAVSELQLNYLAELDKDKKAGTVEKEKEKNESGKEAKASGESGSAKSPRETESAGEDRKATPEEKA